MPSTRRVAPPEVHLWWHTVVLSLPLSPLLRRAVILTDVMFWRARNVEKSGQDMECRHRTTGENERKCRSSRTLQSSMGTTPIPVTALAVLCHRIGSESQRKISVENFRLVAVRSTQRTRLAGRSVRASDLLSPDLLARSGPPRYPQVAR